MLNIYSIVLALKTGWFGSQYALFVGQMSAIKANSEGWDNCSLLEIRKTFGEEMTLK
jgi:hypothetical protein